MFGRFVAMPTIVEISMMFYTGLPSILFIAA